MDSLDNFRKRFEALEQRTEHLQQHSRTVERRLRSWRGIAYGVLVLGVSSWALPLSNAQDRSSGGQYGGLAQRLAALEYKLAHVEGSADEVVITGANLRIVNGLESTDTANGLGNLIVGYNESRDVLGPDVRTGSHNIVVGNLQNFSSFGGLVVGQFNEISEQFASVSGGISNTASGSFSSISGGISNRASDTGASVSGGLSNRASGNLSWVGGGTQNTASGRFSSISGGRSNTATGVGASVSGGELNTASGDDSSVSGGRNRTTPADHNWAAGPLFADN